MAMRDATRQAGGESEGPAGVSTLCMGGGGVRYIDGLIALSYRASWIGLTPVTARKQCPRTDVQATCFHSHAVIQQPSN